jgi:23S rRNA (cytosine1962-C5)-methyltransferase
MFGYTGGATVACGRAGANVCHVDAARAMVDRCGINADMSGIPKNAIRYIVDDCLKFVAREYKRGKKYDAVILDPPNYGRGPAGEVWRLEDNLYSLVNDTVKILSDNPLFYLINSFTTGLQPTVIKNILDLTLKGRNGVSEAYETALPTGEGIVLPCGCSGIMNFNRLKY